MEVAEPGPRLLYFTVSRREGMRRKHELEAEELRGYYRACEMAAANLLRSIEKLRARIAATRDRAEIMADRGRILILKADRSRLEVRRAAFDEERHGIRPPTLAQFNELEDQAREIEALPLGNELPDAVMRLAAETMMTFNSIHPAQG